MEITSIPLFLEYYANIRERTMNVVRAIPREKFDWRYKPDKFTCADMVRHIAAIERYMFAECVQFKPSCYPGHGKELADGYENVLEFMERLHRESMEIFGRITPEDLRKKCVTPAGAPITIWKWLRAMVEHEIHHRGQLYIYLGMLEVTAPPLYGLTSEQVREGSQARAAIMGASSLEE